MAILHKLPPLQNVGANQTAVLPDMPRGMTYLATIFKLGGTFSKAQMTGIRQRINGKQHIDVEGSHLDSMNQHKKMTANAAYMSLNYAAREARTIKGVQIGAIDTSVGVDVMSLEVDIGGATSPTLAAWALLAPPKLIGDSNKFTIRALLKSTHTPGSAGEHNLSVPLGSRLGGTIKSIDVFHTNVTKMQVLKDGGYLQQEGETGLVAFVQDERDRSAQSGHIAYDPTFLGNQSEAIPTTRRDGSPANFEFKFTTSDADTVVTYSDMYQNISGI